MALPTREGETTDARELIRAQAEDLELDAKRVLEDFDAGRVMLPSVALWGDDTGWPADYVRAARGAYEPAPAFGTDFTKTIWGSSTGAQDHLRTGG